MNPGGRSPACPKMGEQRERRNSSQCQILVIVGSKCCKKPRDSGPPRCRFVSGMPRQHRAAGSSPQHPRLVLCGRAGWMQCGIFLATSTPLHRPPAETKSTREGKCEWAAIAFVLPVCRSRSQNRVVKGVNAKVLSLSPRSSGCPCSRLVLLLLSRYLNGK